jgi:hypothetical protein
MALIGLVFGWGIISTIKSLQNVVTQRLAKIDQNMSNALVRADARILTNIAQHFEEPRVRAVIAETASKVSKEAMLAEIRPQVDRFTQQVTEKLREVQQAAATATQQLVTLKQDLAIAQVAVSNTQARGLLLEEAQRPRHLSEDVRDKLKTMLSPLPKFSVHLSCRIGDAEAGDLMLELAAVFGESGFTEVNTAYIPGALAKGVIILVPETTSVIVASAARTLISAGIGARISDDTHSPKDSMMISVGGKASNP